MNDTYYKPHDRPFPGSRFSVDYERPVDGVNVGEPVLRNIPRGRTRLIIEGETKFVERVAELLSPLVEEIRKEIEGGNAAA